MQSSSACRKCFQDFHVDEQHQQIRNAHARFERDLNNYRRNPRQHSLIRQINQWQEESMQKVRQLAEQRTNESIEYLDKHLLHIEKKSKDLAECINRAHCETDLDHLQRRLMVLEERWHHPIDLSIRKHPTSFIDIISLEKNQRATTIAGGNGQGNRIDELNCPSGIYFHDEDQIIYIADCWNHRIVEWRLKEQCCRIAAGGNDKGNQLNQLHCPSDVIVDRKNNTLLISDYGNRRVMRWSRQDYSSGQILISNIDCAYLAMHEDGTLYVSDWKKNEVRRWKTGEIQGTVIAGGNQLNFPTHIFVTSNHTLYISDQNNHRVIKWLKDATSGIVVARGSPTSELSRPRGLVVNQSGDIYIVDEDHHRVMCWSEGDKEGTVILGGHGKGKQANRLNRPVGLAMDRQGNIYIADMWNHRIQTLSKNQIEQMKAKGIAV